MLSTTAAPPVTELHSSSGRDYDGVEGKREEGERDCFRHVPYASHVPSAVLMASVAAAASSVHHVRSREMVELRGELARHLAVAHVDGGRHLQEATRVMRLIDDLEAKTRADTEVCRAQFGRSVELAVLCCSPSESVGQLCIRAGYVLGILTKCFVFEQDCRGRGQPPISLVPLQHKT